MAETPTESLSIKTPFGPLAFTGSTVFLALALGGLTWLVYDKTEKILTKLDDQTVRLVKQVDDQTEQVRHWIEYNNCKTDLAIFVARRTGEIKFYDLPLDLVHCVPQWAGKTQQSK